MKGRYRGIQKMVRPFRVLLGLAVLLLSSCGVTQWQREHLSDPIMRFDEDPQSQRLERHYLPNREGTSGGDGAAGGGCGC